jgi:2-polyprenyl-3-methyl-5-hydroxy-6-metoxy-1,4-benzoquinol methylase
MSDAAYKHFEVASNTWSDRYNVVPRNIWDLDLQMRRENLHLLLQPMLEKFREGRLEVLDAGCGTGDALDGISRNSIHVAGFDLVPDMVNVASGRHPDDDYRTATFADLPFAPASRDIIICLGVLEYLDDIPAALRALCAELKPRGVLCVSFPNGASRMRRLSARLVAIEEWFATTIRRLQGRPRRTSVPQYSHRQWSHDEVCGMLRASGFEVEETLFNTFGVSGRLGSLKPMIRLSRWWTERNRHCADAGTRYGMTMLIKARRRDP